MRSLILGIEIGGTKLQLAVGSPDGDILSGLKDRVNPIEGAQGIQRWMLEHIPNFIKESEDEFQGQFTAIGCGFGGPFDSINGKVLESIQIEGWANFPLRDWLENQFGRPAFVANDSNAATWAEYQLGFGKGCQHFFYTNLGSGVGGGFVFNGHLYDGQGYGAGEFGHTYVPDWTSSQPGKINKIENLCSGWAIESRLNSPDYVPQTSLLFQMKSGREASLTAQDLGQAAEKGDHFALDEIDRISHSMGIGLANVLSLTNVERIAVGGGVSNLGEILLDPIRKYTKKYEFVSSKNHYQIQKCELGDDIVLAGAMLLAKEAFGEL